MTIEKDEGITLKSIPFKERQKILTVFTKKNGIISLILKGISSKNTHLSSVCDPFCKYHFLFKKGRSDIFFLKDVELIQKHLFLREDLETIQIACLMLKAVLSSQMPSKPTPFLYFLFRNYLKRLEFSSQKNALLTSFFLKVLLHDGLLHLKPFCNVCKKPSNHIQKGESLCKDHSSPYSFSFEDQEFTNLQILTFEKTFKNIEIPTSKNFLDKVQNLFYDLL